MCKRSVFSVSVDPVFVFHVGSHSFSQSYLGDVFFAGRVRFGAWALVANLMDFLQT